MLSANSLTTRKIEKHEDPAPPQLLQLEGRIVPATITVTTTSDAVGHTGISLRDAITTANLTSANDIIDFSVTGTITLDSVLQSLPTIASTTSAGTLTITGPGSSSLTISGLDGGNTNRNFNIFTIASGGNLSISGVTVSGAKTSGNGGAFNNAGTLNVYNSTLSGNTATASNGGGAIYSNGTLNVYNSTLSSNTATNGGGIFNSSTVNVSNSDISGNTAGGGGGIWNQGNNLTVSNSTLSGNSATSGGGALRNFGGTITITNSTLSGNSGSSGGGIFNNSTSTLNIANTIIANSISGGDYAGTGTVNRISPSTAANNLVSSGSFSWATTKTSAEINLGTLANNGGPTQTLALLSGSVAIGAGNATISNATPINGKDQRGINRTTSDIGAYSFGIQVTNTTDSNTVGSGSLRAAINLANTTPGNDQISFNLTGSGPYTITLNGTLGALPTILDATALINGAPRGTVTITGLGASSLTISGLDGGNNARNFRIFNIASGGNLFISGVTVSGANTSGVGGPSNTGTAYGGGFFNSGILTVNNSTISGNTANNGIGGSGSGSGGGIFNYNGTLSVSNSTISGNTAGMLGGGIENRGGTVTVNNSTLSGNTAGGGGGIHNGGNLTVNNSTLSGNTAGGGGGISNNATLNISNSTISGNTAVVGGGIYNYGPQYQMGSFGTLNIANTIIANSTNGASTPAPIDDYAGGGTVVLIGSATAANNLITQLAPIPGIGDWATTVTSVQLNLGPLQNNGGPTFTMALLTGSAAISAGNATISNATPINGKDQRGINRTTSDIGAYSFGIQVTTTADTVNSTDNVTSLREAITLANTTPGNDQISFNLTGASTYTITLNGTLGALPAIIDAGTAIPGGTAGTVTITGLGASSLTISGSDITNVNNATRDFNIFNIAAGGNLLISGVTVSGGQQNNNGGGFFNSGILTVNNSTISGNTVNFLTGSSTGSGGGIFNFNGILTVNNSTISGNTVNFIGGPGTGSGGGILNNGGILTVNNSTISGNTSSFAGGGGISNRPGGTVTVSNSTLSGNTALFGGGIENRGTLNIANTIIANSTSGGDYASNGGTIGTNSNNLVEDGTLPAGTNNKTGDPNLSPLQNNGGPTATMALLTPSPAISTTLLVTPNLDQRGFTRINNDIGAYTYYVPPTVASISPTSGSTAGGTVITITGTNFVAGPNVVSINGVAATNVNFVSATSITATTSAGTAGANKSVLVTSAGGMLQTHCSLMLPHLAQHLHPRHLTRHRHQHQYLRIERRWW